MLALTESRDPEIESLRKAAETARALGGGVSNDVRARAVALRKGGFSAEDVARAIGVHETTLYGWVRSGKYDAAFRSLTIESVVRELPCVEGSQLETSHAALLRVRYPKGTRVTIPVGALTPEIIVTLLSVETSR